MRDILFKAKTESGRWIEGDLIRYESGEMAILEKPFSEYGYEATEISKRTKVIPDTICQYTGLTDKNGNKIWENDIVVYDNSPYNAYCTPHRGEITFRNGCMCLKYVLYGSITYMSFLSDDFFAMKCEVLGSMLDELN